jgi:hypothetical protein
MEYEEMTIHPVNLSIKENWNVKFDFENDRFNSNQVVKKDDIIGSIF